MKRYCLLFLILPLLTSAQNKSVPAKNTQAKTSSINKDGWRDLKWGATPDEVKSKYNTSEYNKENKWCIVEKYELTGRNFRLIFHFDAASHLESVVLSKTNFYLKKETKYRWEVKDEMGKLQNDIENGLTAKFGNPSFTSNSPNYIRDWNFPNLKIEIKSRISYQPKLKGLEIDDSEEENDLVLDDSFMIEYSKPNKSEIDKF